MAKTDVRVALVLHNIRSVYNVGAMFRTADAAGVEKIYLCGYTPMPTDRFRRMRADISKAALGAENSVPWEHVKNPYRVVSMLKKDGWHVAAVEQDKNSVDYKKFRPKEKTALVLGNEVRGISKTFLKNCDSIVEIPMKGKKESLNVAVAAGIVLFRLLDR
jgi:tRNA G18 (ribose-2'-O)-methylase SpoU